MVFSSQQPGPGSHHTKAYVMLQAYLSEKGKMSTYSEKAWYLVYITLSYNSVSRKSWFYLKLNL